jgi:hypothetical protein
MPLLEVIFHYIIFFFISSNEDKRLAVKTTSVVYSSEYLATEPEVLGSISGAVGYSEK